MKKAYAAVFTGPNAPFELKEYDVLPPPEGYARLKLISSGVCGTDLHIHRGKLPVGAPSIIGHEFIGRIDAISEADAAKSGLKVGDAAIVYIACPCGTCVLCHDGDDANCVNMGVTNSGNPETPPHFWGGYCEYSFSPMDNLIRIPNHLDPMSVSVFACAGPTALHAFALSLRAGFDPKSAKTAVVQGLGPLGVFAVAYLKHLGIPYIAAVGARENPERAEAVKALGATEVFSLEADGEAKLGESVQKASNGLGADLVFEASGNPGAIPLGIDLLRNRGVYLVPGQYSDSGRIEIAPQLITFKALRILGSSQYSKADIDTYLNFLSENTAFGDAALSLADKYPLKDVQNALKNAASGKNIKTLLV